MPRRAAGSGKAQRDQIRDRMRAVGSTVPQIAAEMGRRFNLRPRQAWRYALGWAQFKVAQEYNALHAGAKLSDNRISDYEVWPHGGAQPSLRYLANLAATYGHGCALAVLVDLDDLEHLDIAARRVILGGVAPKTSVPVQLEEAHNCMNSERTSAPAPVVVTGVARPWVRERLLPREAGGLPSREEVMLTADESAAFSRWSAITNVDNDVLDQMDADVADIAARYLSDPPSAVFSRLIHARDHVLDLIAKRQPPRLTMRLYTVAGQVCAILAHASADLGFGYAANTQARTALRCADHAGYPVLIPYVKWVQSNAAYWDGRFNDAAELVESAMRVAPSNGTSMLRLASQLARIEAGRQRPTAVHDALGLAERAMTEPTANEPGVFAFSAGKAAYYASEAHRELGEPENLRAAVEWAEVAVEQFTTQPRRSTALTAAARLDLARAHLAGGNLDAVAEQLVSILHDTTDEHRTIPMIGRARALRDLLRQTDTAASPVKAVQDDLSRFCLTPATAPAELTSAQDDVN